MVDLYYIGGAVFLVILGFIVGRYQEHRHWDSIRKRESQYKNRIFVSNKKEIPADIKVKESFLCVGCVVIASDYYKTFAARLKSLIGGHLRTLETLLQRGRKEAVLRAIEDAQRRGATLIVNLRIETTTIGRASRRGKGLPMAEVLAYGTAIVPAESNSMQQ